MKAFTNAALLFLFSICPSDASAESVKERFKSCAQSGFCSRQRQNQLNGDHSSHRWILQGEPVVHPTNSSILTLNLSNHGKKTIKFDLHLYKEDKIRFILHSPSTNSSNDSDHPNDSDQPKDTIFKGRWSPPRTEEDVILESKQNPAEWPSPEYHQIEQGKSVNSFLYRRGNSKIQIIKNPFSIVVNDFFHINHHNLLLLEEEEDDDDNNSNNIKIGKIETFRGRFSDAQNINGLQSVGIDVCTIATQPSSLYGLPEHSLPFQLKPTAITDEPLRLFNTDVFPFPLNSTTALYGSIPYLTILPGDSLSNCNYGVLWNNPSETWVTILGSSGADSSFSSAAGGGGGNDGSQYTTDSSQILKDGAHFMSEAGVIDLWVWWSPSPRGLLEQYYGITGSPTLPPLYSLGYHQSRWNYRTQQELLEVSEEASRERFPVDVFWLDIEYTDRKKYFTWNLSAFPNPSKMILRLWNDWGRRLVTILDPHIKEERGYWVYDSLKEKSQNGYNRFLVRNPKKSGSADQIFSGQCWPGPSVWPNFAFPAVRRWWKDLLLGGAGAGLREWGSGLVGVWIDMNEPSVFSGPEVTLPKDMMHWIPQSGWVEHRNLHNLYGLYQHRASWEALSEVEVGSKPSCDDCNDGYDSGFSSKTISGKNNNNNKTNKTNANSTNIILNRISKYLRDLLTIRTRKEKRKQRPFVLTRSFFAGSQRWGPAWTGDIRSDWQHLKQVTPMLLSLSMAGMPWVGADVGGFYGPKPSETLQLRWLQSSVFHPFMRHHSHQDTERREPWLLSERLDYKANALEAVRLRYSLLPQLYTLFFLSSAPPDMLLPPYLQQDRSGPPLRPMFFEFPDDPSLRGVDSQFMLGSSLLVAPVTEDEDQGQRELRVLVPTIGTWYLWWGPHAIKGKTKKLFYSYPSDSTTAAAGGGTINTAIDTVDTTIDAIDAIDAIDTIDITTTTTKSTTTMAKEEMIRVYNDKIPVLLRGGYGVVLRDQSPKRDSSASMLDDPLLVHFALSSSSLQSEVALVEDDFISLGAPFSSCLLKCSIVEGRILKISSGSIYQSPSSSSSSSQKRNTLISTFSIFLESYSFKAIKTSSHPVVFKSVSDSRFDILVDAEGRLGGIGVGEEFEIVVEFI